MLDEGVVAEAQDIDLCLILGAGLAVPPRRHHARTWTAAALPSGSHKGDSSPMGSRVCLPPE